MKLVAKICFFAETSVSVLFAPYHSWHVLSFLSSYMRSDYDELGMTGTALAVGSGQFPCKGMRKLLFVQDFFVPSVWRLTDHRQVIGGKIATGKRDRAVLCLHKPGWLA